MERDEQTSPGMELGFEEEYEAGEGAYAADGRIYSAVLGERKLEGRKMGVLAKKKLRNLEAGDVLYGQVGMIVEPVVALVEVFAPKKEEIYFPANSEYCSLHASSLRRGFVRNIRDELKIGDILRVKVSEVKKTEICLTTNEENLGVVKAFCAFDRAPLKLEGKVLVCPSCGEICTRKISNDYGNVQGI